MGSGPNRIFVSHVAGIGRTVLSLPALRALRSSYPHAYLAVASSYRGAGIIELSMIANDVYPVSRLVESGNPRAVLSVIRSIRDLRQTQFDTIIDFPGQPGSIVARMAAASGRPKVLLPGLRDLAFPARKTARHLSQVYLDRVAELGAYPVDNQPLLETNPEADQRFERRIEKLKWDDGTLLVGVAMRNYSEQAGVGAWASTLASSLSSRVIMIPARYEKSLARKVVKELPDNRQAVWAMKNISDVVSTFARLSLLITERAGLAHLAGALGTPALLIGQVRPEERPLAGNIAVVPSHTDSRTILEQASLLIMASRAEYLRSR